MLRRVILSEDITSVIQILLQSPQSLEILQMDSELLATLRARCEHTHAKLMAEAQDVSKLLQII